MSRRDRQGQRHTWHGKLGTAAGYRRNGYASVSGAQSKRQRLGASHTHFAKAERGGGNGQLRLALGAHTGTAHVQGKGPVGGVAENGDMRAQPTFRSGRESHVYLKAFSCGQNRRQLRFRDLELAIARIHARNRYPRFTVVGYGDGKSSSLAHHDVAVM